MSASSTRVLLGRLAPLLGLVILCIVLTLASPHFFTADNLVNVLRQSSVNALLALGQLVVIITAGIDLSIGSILGVTSVSLAMMMRAGVPPLLAVLGTLVIGALIGLVNGLLLTRLRLPHPFISTLGTMNVARGAAMILAAGVPISGLPDGFRVPLNADLMGVPAAVIVVAIAGLIIHFLLERTVYGRDIFAIGGNKDAARLAGVPVGSRLELAYTVSGLMAAVAALVLAARMNSGFPLAGTGAELDAIAAVIIGGASFFGGVGTVGGTIIGALFIGLLRNGLNLLDVSAYWQMIVIGVVIVAAVVVDVLRARQRD